MFINNNFKKSLFSIKIQSQNHRKVSTYGGPGSGRYPAGSGENPQAEERRRKALDKVFKNIEKKNIERREVKKLSKNLSDDEITSKLGGGDKTKGSCFSLSMAFMANKAGLDVTDYRGGNSQDFFARNAWKIADAIGLKVEGTDKTDAFNKAMELVGTDGEPAIVGIGKHAAVFMYNTEKKNYQYMELQDANADRNHWSYASAETYYDRFGMKYNDEKPKDALVITSKDIANNKDTFTDLLTYINTSTDEQQKGAGGGIK